MFFFYEIKNIYFLSVENIVVLPVSTCAESLMKTTVFIGLGKQPGRIHEVFA